MSTNSRLRTTAWACIVTGVIAVPASAQITTGTVSGTVTDSQGGVVPGASVLLISDTQATRLGPMVTNSTGAYVFPNVTADTYTVEITLTGFKMVSRKGIRVGGGERVAVGALVLEPGGLTDRIDVRAESPLVQTASGERSSAVERVQLEMLPISSHNFVDFLATQPGLNTGNMNPGSQMRRIGGGGQDNVMLDGLSALDTGNNGVMGGMNLPVEAIAEVQVLTSGYSAEYGRSSGIQVSGVTRSGTNRLSGSIYDYERNSDWNANSWQNRQNGNPKAVSKQRDWGYSIGGPVGRPGGNNKLFFFYTHEYRPRTTGNNTVNYRMPTAEERRGDFSQTLDNNGALYNLIYDQTTGLPKSSCSATVKTACFQDGGVVGRIPIGRLYGPGIALLNQYPLPNVAQVPGQSYNYTTTLPVQDQLSYTPVVRVDYQATGALRATWKFAGQSARVVPGYTVNGQGGQGPLPNFTESLQKFPLSFNTSASVNYSLSPTMFLEATYGVNQNRLGTPSIGPYSNRNNVVCPSALAGQIPDCTLGKIAYLFPDAGIVDPGYYEYGALQEIGTPFFEGGRILLPPQLSWGGTRLSNPPPSLNYPGWLNINRIQQASVSLTKIQGSHTLKAGLYFEHSYKAQNTGGNLTFQGALNFGVNTSNPLETTFPYANAALGIFSTYGQGSRFIEGNFYYNNIEWYLQDNWKVNRKLTLDYGLRIAHDGPYTDNLRQVANFFPDKWSIDNAPALYVPGCVTTSPCSGNNRQAKDPRTGALLGPGTASLIGTVIVGTGDFANGMVQAGDGIAKAGYTWPKIAVAPRLGAAYDVTGQQKLVVRGSVGLYFDRPDGNTAFGTVANPPTATGLTQQWGRLSELANSSLSFGPVPNIVVNLYDSAIPKDTQWNLGAQVALPWRSSLDVSYVGHHAFDVLGGTQNGNPVNLNAIDVGTTLTSEGIDPTTGSALNNNLLRPFQGYGNINVQWARFHRTFHSIQTVFNRRFANGFSFGGSHTWTISDKGNTNMVAPQLRLVHAPDGSYSISPDQAIAEELFANQGTRTHILTTNFVWDLPDLPADGSLQRGLGIVLNDWQLSGVFRADSGNRFDIGYSYNNGPTGQALTGSPDYSARVTIHDLAALGSGCSSNQYQQLGNIMLPATSGASPVRTNAVSGPQVGSRGLESGRSLLSGCNDRTLDLAIQRTIQMGGNRRLVLRADVFNSLNTVIYTSRQSSLQFNSVTDQTIRNSQYRADGSLDPNRLRPNQAGFGAATAAAPLRSVQLQIKFVF